VEPDQHSGPEQGTGDRAPDPGAGISREVPDTHEAAPAEGALTEPAGPESDPSLRTDAIMSKLPRTRPQRITGRRHREQPRQPRAGRETPATSQEPSPTPRGDKGAPARRTTAARPKSRAATTQQAAKQPKRPARRGSAAAVPVTQAATPRDPARRRAESGNAPGLPRLAVDGAIEAAKLPLRVGGRLTLRALDAAARGLRGR
jgi:hypothetical protein